MDDNVQKVITAFGITEDTIMLPFDPEWVGRAPTTIYAVKYREQDSTGTMRTFVFLLGSKSAYDQRINGPEKGQGLKGTVTWEAITKPVKVAKVQIEGQGGLF